MPVLVVTPPIEEPVSLSEAKDHLRVEIDWTADDGYIQGLITAATEFCEKRQRRSYVTRTLEHSRDSFPADRRMELPLPKLQAVVSVTYMDDQGVEHTFDPAGYVTDTRSLVGAVVLKPGVTWPTVALWPTNAVVVRYTAGYGTAAAVPRRIKQAVLLLVGHWYENREAVLTGTISKEIEFAVNALLALDYVV